jgi:hypothetical protein
LAEGKNTKESTVVNIHAANNKYDNLRVYSAGQAKKIPPGKEG